MDFLTFIKGLSLSLTAPITRTKRVVYYSIDSLYGKPFVYFTGIHRGDTIDPFPIFETREDIIIKGMVLRGIHSFKDCQYHFYEIPVVHDLDLETPNKKYKITPYEILSIRHVEGIPIDPSSILFLKAHSYLCILREAEEEDGEEIKIPGSFYVSIPKSRVKEQLFLPSVTEGIFKKGYYLYTYERCLEVPIDQYMTLPNTIQLEQGTKAKCLLQKGHLLIGSHNMGPVSVPPHTTFTITHVTPEWITLHTSKPLLEPEEWCILRYFCNMENHWIGPRAKEGYDSFSYDQTFKTVNPDRIRCVSIHGQNKPDKLATADIMVV